MAFDFNSPFFWDGAQTASELKRVFDICNGCRRCHNLCPAFNDLFERLDRASVDGDAEKLGPEDLTSVTELCYQCKLCFNHCPYTPPHRWQVDFPRLMLRSKAVETKLEGLSLQDRILGATDRIGRVAATFAPLANWANRNALGRWLIEKLLGIHRKRLLPGYAPETFARWLEKRDREVKQAQRKVALFYTCTVNFNKPEIGKACVRVLERNAIEVACSAQVCCGMPFLDGGDIVATKKRAESNINALWPWVERGYDVVVPGPTCSYMLKHEYPLLLEGEAVRTVARRTFDICEYLMALHREGKLDTGFARGVGRIAYQIPCHLRAQNLGYKSRDLMQLVPGTSVDLIEKCSAIDGTWGLKRQYFDLSLKVAEPLLREIRSCGADLTASDCPLAALQIEQGTGQKPLHPIQILEMAYGINGESET